VNVKKWCFSPAREKVNLTEEGIPMPGGIAATGRESRRRLEFRKGSSQLAKANPVQIEGLNAPHRAALIRDLVNGRVRARSFLERR
jgi:hypothetical protein